MASDRAGERDAHEPITEALTGDDEHGPDLFVGPTERPDEYQLIGRGARGGEGIVWRAWYRGSLPSPVEVAVKQFLAPADEQPPAWPSTRTVNRWYEQLRLLQTVHIDHVAAYRELFAGWPPHRAGDAAGEPPPALRNWYLVMEWIEGPTLDAVVAAGQLSLLERVGFVWQMAQAVDQLHAGASTHGMPVLHRDIKPGNIIIHPTRGAVLVDFGLLRVVEDNVMTEVPRWTGAYLAPEVHANKASASRASDVWSVAATAFFALTGEHPSPMNPARMIAQLRTSLAGRVPDPEQAIATLMRVLDAPPEARPGSAAAWVSELGQTLAVPRATGTASVEARAANASRRRRRMFIAAPIIAIVAIAGVTLAAVAASHGGSHPSPTTTVATSSAFQVASTGTFTLDGARVIVSGTGTGNPLGSVTLRSIGRVASYPQLPPACTTDGSRTTATEDLTTNTDDVVHLNLVGTTCVAGTNAGGFYVFDFTGTYRVTGGTGPYRRATGTGTLHGHFEFVDSSGGTSVGTLTGSLVTASEK